MLSRQRLETVVLRRAAASDLSAVTNAAESGAADAPGLSDQPRGRGVARRYKLIAGILVSATIMALARHELKTSALQSHLYSWYASGVSFGMGPGRSLEIAFPATGPFDRTRGYTSIPHFVERLTSSGYRVTGQARASHRLLSLLKWGIHPPYEEPSGAGLKIRARDGRLVYEQDSSKLQFTSFEEIPPIIVRSLLFIENRELEFVSSPTANPAIEWDRLGWAGILYAGRKVGLPVPVEGGSTLAVQLEKYRHSEKGRTSSASEKLRQILGASLRVYKSGPETIAERHKIIVDYLNTVPFAAQVGYGEVHGIGEGLYAWFGWDLRRTMEALSSESADERAAALKRVLALLCSVRAPSFYLTSNRGALESRVRSYTHLMRDNAVFNPIFASRLEAAPLTFLSRAPVTPRAAYSERKHIDAMRVYLQQSLGVSGLYDLDRLHLEVDTPIDAKLQGEILDLLAKLHDPEFVDQNGLRGERLLAGVDPGKVIYSMTLFERTPEGNLLRAQADTLDKPFDLNTGMKMELGSTAKLRTIAHYLQLVASLYGEMKMLSTYELMLRSGSSMRDPLTAWAAETMRQQPDLSLDGFLGLALDRKYSTSTGEVFFTGGGAHTFNNFDSKDDGQFLMLREAFRRSTNLVFIRLMRDLVRYHQARLPYNAEAVMTELDNPIRRQLLDQAADLEATHILFRAFKDFRNLKEDELVSRILGSRSHSNRHLSMLYFAWNPNAGAEDLRHWLLPRFRDTSLAEAERLLHSYDPSRLNLLDYGYLLDRHPLEVWCAGVLRNNPDLTWHDLLSKSEEARRQVSTWLFKVKNRKPQDIRLRVRIEQDAFERMTPDWQKFGFPFERLVPSLATAIGSSSDRPIALAELVGIIMNDGVRLPPIQATRLRIAAGTPYETVLEPVAENEGRVMAPAVAHALRELLATVVEGGTAQRLAGAFVLPNGSRIVAGGKTGSGDNRYDTFTRGGGVSSSRSINRTATFVFYIGNKYFGVITAHVDGRAAAQYRFTSALPVTVLKMLAPSLNSRLAESVTP